MLGLETVVWCGDLVTVGGTGLVGGRGGSPWEGIASPEVGRTRLEESQRIGRQARITRATPYKGCGRSNELEAIRPESWAVTWGKSVNEAFE